MRQFLGLCQGRIERNAHVGLSSGRVKLKSVGQCRVDQTGAWQGWPATARDRDDEGQSRATRLAAVSCNMRTPGGSGLCQGGTGRKAHVGLGSGRVKLEMLGVSVVQVRQERGRDDTGRSRGAWLSVSQRKRTNRSPGCAPTELQRKGPLQRNCSVRQG